MLNTLFEGQAVWFTVPALLGTVVFLFRLSLMLIGGADADAGGDAGDLGDGGDHGDPGHAFEILSVQSVAAFLMGFGWGGIGGLKGGGWTMPMALLCAVGGGVLMVWLLALLLRGIFELESSGNLDLRDALGAEGQVYARVPEAGQGQGRVRLVIDQRQRIYAAVSSSGALQSNTRVRVVHVNSDNTLTVEPA